MKRKILIDCTSGIDDVLALLLLKRLKQLDIVAVTTCFGRGGVKKNYENLRRIAATLEMNVVVAGGAQKAIIEENENLFSSDEKNNSADRSKKEDINQHTENQHAWDLIYDIAIREKGNLEIITLGPLTNLAIALLKHEDLKDCIKSLTIMGGSAAVGDVTPFGEENVLWDPYAFQVVMQSRIKPIVMVGLNAVENIQLTNEFLCLLKGKNRYGQIRDEKESRLVYAAASAAVAAFPELATMKAYHVDVELGRTGQYGRTIVDTRLHTTAEKNVNVVEKIDCGRFLDFLKEAEKDYN